MESFLFLTSIVRGRGWPSHAALEGAVRGWNGDSVGGVDAVPRHGRPAFGNHWQVPPPLPSHRPSSLYLSIQVLGGP